MTPAMSLSGLFAEEADLIGSKMVKKKLFLDHTVDTVAERAVGRLSGRISGHFGSAMSTPEALNDSLEHGDRLSSHQNRSCQEVHQKHVISSVHVITWAFLRFIAVKTVWQW
jgi:hypothetical protein